MPIRIHHELPAYKSLQNENIFVMSKERAEHQDIRPLKIIILNISLDFSRIFKILFLYTKSNFPKDLCL